MGKIKRCDDFLTRYVHSKLIKIISLHYLKLMRTIKEQEGKI